MWFCFSNDEREILRRGLEREWNFHLVSSRHEEAKAAKALLDRFDEVTQPHPNARAFADAARASMRLSDPDEIDAEDFVSVSDDGAYVMAWLWVDNEDAGLDVDDGETFHLEIVLLATNEIIARETVQCERIEASARLSTLWNQSPAALSGDRYLGRLTTADGLLLETVGGPDGP